MLRMFATIVKFMVLGYLALAVQCLVQVQRADSLWRKGLSFAGAALLFGLPIGVVLAWIPNPSPAPTPVEEMTPPAPVHTLTPSHSSRAKVIAVIDGDSLEVQIGTDHIERVRLLGLDAPERGMCFGDESAAGARSLLQEQEVMLEADSQTPNRDKFGRLSRYVRLSDGRLANQLLIEAGYAFEYTYFSPYDHVNEFRAAELQARAQSLGLWGETSCTPVERPEHLPQAIHSTLPANVTAAKVVRIVDGDTVEVSPGGSVRLIGIDTPESGRCYTQEATNRQEVLTAGQTVFLEADPSQDDRDRYNRLLRYIWLPDGRMVNALLVAEGHAYEYTYREPYRYTEQFMQLEHEAQRADLGLWAATTCDSLSGRRYSNAYYSN